MDELFELTARRRVLTWAAAGLVGAGLAAAGLPGPAEAAPGDNTEGYGKKCKSRRHKGHKVTVCEDKPVHGVLRHAVFIDGVALLVHQSPAGGYVSPLHMFLRFDSLWDLGFAAAERLGKQARLRTIPRRRTRLVPALPDLEVPGPPRVRRNAVSLTASERQAFVNAVLEVKRRGIYDAFVEAHVAQFNNHAHNGPSFLPWHRAYLYHFETELQKIDPSVTIPYWDWTAESSYGQPPFTDDFLGGPGQFSFPPPFPAYAGGEVMTGPFAHSNGNWDINVIGGDPAKYLKRNVLIAGLPTSEDVTAVLDMVPYAEGPGWSGGFVGAAETLGPPAMGLHGAAHNTIGGHMFGSDSPNDPVFWLHHAMLDKIWVEWQNMHPGEAQYLPVRKEPGGVVAIDDPMEPWHSDLNRQVTPAHLLDHSIFAVYQ